jgi:hypothetical protein
MAAGDSGTRRSSRSPQVGGEGRSYCRSRTRGKEVKLIQVNHL